MGRSSKLTKTIENNGVEGSEDPINNLPEGLMDNILQRLPLSVVAKISVLSKKWHNNWSSLKCLRFDNRLWKRQHKPGRHSVEWQTFCSIISNVLLLHQGPIHDFILHIPSFELTSVQDITLFLSRLMCFLSRNGVRKLHLVQTTYTPGVTLRSNIYMCRELEELKINNIILEPPPVEFQHFLHLRKLELISMDLDEDMVRRLIAACPKLDTLKIQRCSGFDHLVIDAPTLGNLILVGRFPSLVLKNVPNLAWLQLCLKVESILLSIEAAFATLQSLTLGRKTMKFLVKHGLRKSLPLPLSNLNELCLQNLDLYRANTFFCTFGLLQSCPFIRKLSISVATTANFVIQHQHSSDNNYKLNHLLEVKFDGVTESWAELNLIEYVLHISTVLEKMFIVFGDLNRRSELKVQRQLNGFQRASPKARIIFHMKGVSKK